MPLHPIPDPIAWPAATTPAAAASGSLTVVDGASLVLAVAPTGSITVVDGASLVDGETFTVPDGVNPPTVFEFDDDATVTPGNVAVAFTALDDLATVKAAVLAAINGVGAALAVTASSGGAGVVLLANDVASADGNAAITDTVAAAGFTHTGMAGGVSEGETFTIPDGVNPATVFEFDSDGLVASGNVPVPFTSLDDLATVKAAAIAAINGVGAGLAVTASSGGAGVVLLTNDADGAAGNVAITDTVADPGFSYTGMSGGVSPARLTLTSYDLLWLAMGGVLSDAASNTQLRLEPATCQPGAFLRAHEAAILPPNLTGTSKAIGTKITATAGLPAEGASPSADDLSDEVQRAMDAQAALATRR